MNRSVMPVRAMLMAAWMFTTAGASGQQWNCPARAVGWVSEHSGKSLQLSFEQRGRFESRTAQSFGGVPDLEAGFIRTRFGATLKPKRWLKVSAMVQDARAPFYGANAPSSAHDGADLQEAYVEVAGEAKRGFGLSAGRRMVNYGDARLIGSPQWGYLARTYDHGRFWYRAGKAQLEFLLVSPVKSVLDGFNKPQLGERVWGTYSTFGGLWAGSGLDLYVLRHDQNATAGFKGGSPLLGTDRLEVNTFGGRWMTPVGAGWKAVAELALQNGRVGAADHRAAGLASSLNRRLTAGKRNLDLTAEYKYASGTADPQDQSRVGTFDQLFPANHDKFGHLDLFGWRNRHNARAVAALGLTKNLMVSSMFNDTWLASAKDALYNSSGKSVARSASGTAGRHVGYEADIFMTWKVNRSFQFGAGYGHLFAGEFVRKTTKGESPNYAYVFYAYSF